MVSKPSTTDQRDQDADSSRVHFHPQSTHRSHKSAQVTRVFCPCLTLVTYTVKAWIVMGKTMRFLKNVNSLPYSHSTDWYTLQFFSNKNHSCLHFTFTGKHEAHLPACVSVLTNCRVLLINIPNQYAMQLWSSLNASLSTGTTLNMLSKSTCFIYRVNTCIFITRFL